MPPGEDKTRSQYPPDEGGSVKWIGPVDIALVYKMREQLCVRSLCVQRLCVQRLWLRD